MTMITPSYLGETIEYSSLHACRSTLEDPTMNSNPKYRVPTSQIRSQPTSSPTCRRVGAGDALLCLRRRDISTRALHSVTLRLKAQMRFLSIKTLRVFGGRRSSVAS